MMGSWVATTPCPEAWTLALAAGVHPPHLPPSRPGAGLPLRLPLARPQPQLQAGPGVHHEPIARRGPATGAATSLKDFRPWNPKPLVGLLRPPCSQCVVRQIFHNFFFQTPPLVWGWPKNFDEKFSPVGWASMPIGTPPGSGREGAR